MKLSECPRGRVPEIAVIGQHYLMFRAPCECDRNSVIELDSVEEGPNGKPLVTFVFTCPKCRRFWHFKVYCGLHPGYDDSWTDKIRRLKRFSRDDQ